VEVALYYAVLNARDVHNVNFELAWLKPHSGNYDVPEPMSGSPRLWIMRIL